jgi:hypothetical protein
MASGTAAANTKVEKACNRDSVEFMTLSHVTEQETSSITYTIGLKGITDAIDAAWDSAHTEIQALSGVVKEFSAATFESLKELSAATDDLLDKLDFEGFQDNKQPIVNVTQEDGLVNAEVGRIDSEFIDVDSATTLNELLQEIIENIEANAVSSEDKTVTVETTDEGTDLSVNIDGKTIVKDNDGVISSAVKLVKVAGTGTVKETYVLADKDGNALDGDEIVINKDQAFVGARLGHSGATVDPATGEITDGSGEDVLILEYQNQEGDYVIVEIPLGDFLRESEFKDGLQVNENHEVSVKLDSTSEELVVGDSGLTAPVLSVGPNGIKVDNIQDAIDYAVQDLVGSIDADETGVSQDGHVTVEVVQEDTEIVAVNVETSDIASKDVLDTVIESVGLGTDGEFVPDASGKYISAATDVRNEIKLLDSALNEVSEKLDSASVAEGTSVENLVQLDVTNDGNGATAITINDSQLKTTIDGINEALSAETIAREEADAELLGSSASTSGENSIWGIKKLLEQLNTKAVQDAEFYVLTDTDRNPAHCNAGLKVEDNGDNGKKIQLDLTLLKVDCGEY